MVTRRRSRALMLVIALLVAGGAVFGIRAAFRRDSDPYSFARRPGSSMDASEAASEALDAIDALAGEPFLEVESLGYIEESRIDLVVSLDASASSFESREVLTVEAEIGDPASDEPIISERVLVGSTMYARIIQPGEATTPGFEALDLSGREDEFIEGAYVMDGRIFDSPAVLAKLVEEVPFVAERLRPRRLDGVEAAGIRLSFDSTVVGDWLVASGLEQFVSPHEGVTEMEIWSTGGVLRELLATGVQFHDGEALDDVAAVIHYRPVDQLSISTPD